MLKTDLDLFTEQVYCFTPQGDVKTLPAGSTPIDFAYMIHTAVGNKMVGARVNGRQVPIDYKPLRGQVTESRLLLRRIRMGQAGTGFLL